jgi:XTP/dITP diphosphohydrolase
VQKVLFATGNPHKLTEVAAVFEPLGIEIIGLDSLSSIPPEPDEDQDTFEGNARLKARAYARAAGCPCLADDSGLEVDALDGEPGVRSARWAGVDGTREERDSANNRLLVERMAGVPKEQRHARFVCALCLVDADGETLAETRGEFPGVIVDEPRGENGFGYDPYLYLPEEKRTSAELTAKEKNARSHRGAATRAMAEKLVRIESDEPA